MVAQLRRLAESRGFQNTVTGVIVLAGALAGIETYPWMAERFHTVLEVLDKVILAIFVLEVVVKIGAEGDKPWRYFLDPWNLFDFVIVVVAILPIDSSGVAVLRLARLLRVLKLVRALPQLQLLVSALLKSIPSMGYVSLLLGLLFYLYGVAATHLFGANDPVHFGRLEISLLTLFRVVTLEGWTEILYIQMYGCAAYGYEQWPELCTASTPVPLVANAFFISFILLGTMVIMNLFVGVIMNGMEEAQKEQLEAIQASQYLHGETLETEIADLKLQLLAAAEQLEKVEAFVRTVRRKAS
jgi:voltage-gated sodium channel